jgi:hypothetical protein
MRSILRTALGLAALAVLTSATQPTLHAQAAPPTAADTAEARARSDLRNLVTAQEAFYSDSARYAGSLAQIRGFRASTGNSIRITFASDQGWAGVLTSTTLVGSCTVFVGTVVIPTDSARVLGTERDKLIGREGTPTCDRQPGAGTPRGGGR